MLALKKPYTYDYNQNRILIVDDDELVVESFVKTLAEYKELIIDRTTDSKHALKLINSKDYDIVITDIVMPELDGLQLLRKIKKIRPDTEVILITAFSSYNSALDAIHFGASDYLAKPFNPEELKVRILKAIKKRRSLKEKTEKVQEMERLSYTIAHDFKSILATIKALIKILKEEYSEKLDENANFILNRINANINDMEKMVEGLLQYTKIGKYNVLWETINTRSFLDEIIQNFQPILKSKSIRLIIEKDMPDVYFYRDGLKHIFYNLIDNAIKYSKNTEDSYIKIGTIKEEKYRHEGYITFFVEDNGVGIDEEKINNIFEFFQRGDINQQGYGIGLAIVKRILEKAGCEIYVQSEKGKYTVFYFTLPEAKKLTEEL